MHVGAQGVQLGGAADMERICLVLGSGVPSLNPSLTRDDSRIGPFPSETDKLSVGHPLGRKTAVLTRQYAPMIWHAPIATPGQEVSGGNQTA